MPRWFAVVLSALPALGVAEGCSSDSAQAGHQPLADAGREGAAHAVDPFNGDCESARWADVSEACWSCACKACKDTLNACDNDCMDVLFCSFEHHTLVNVAADIGCEVRATATECFNTAKAQAVAPPLVQFDTCLIGAPKTTGFRACEVECGIPYSGDVCQRYPEPPPAHGG